MEDLNALIAKMAASIYAGRLPAYPETIGPEGLGRLMQVSIAEAKVIWQLTLKHEQE